MTSRFDPRLHGRPPLAVPPRRLMLAAAVAILCLPAPQLSNAAAGPTAGAGDGLFVGNGAGGGADSLCADGEVMRICLPPDYMKFELPEDGTTNVVSIGVDIKDIPKVDDKDFSITLNAYFIVKWRDDRLIVMNRNRSRTTRMHSPSTSTSTTERPRSSILASKAPKGRDAIHSTPPPESDDPRLTAINLQILRKLWLPDVEILNLKEFETHSVLSKLEGIWIDKDHQLMYALATRITFICPMKFNAFPMDIQVCMFQVGSFNYDMSRMVFINEFVPNEKDAIQSILDYGIEIRDLNPEDSHYMALGMNYSVAGFEMVLTRKISFYVVTYYLPSGLFVVVSWISFLVNPEVIPGRMTLLVTIFLVLINIFNTIQTNSPKAEGLTAIEAWVIACIIFVFGALGEYTVILLKIKLKKIQSRKSSRSSSKRGIDPPMPTTATVNNVSGSNATTTTTTTIPARPGSLTNNGAMLHHAHSNGGYGRRDNYGRTDLLFLCIFPCLFSLFNAFYWCSLYWWRWADRQSRPTS